MTGYLDRLAARTQGARAAAGPRPRALFEDASALPGLADEVATREGETTRSDSPPSRRVADDGSAALAPPGTAAVTASDRRVADPEADAVGGRMPQPPREGGSRHPSPAVAPAHSAANDAPAVTQRRAPIEVAPLLQAQPAQPPQADQPVLQAQPARQAQQAAAAAPEVPRDPVRARPAQPEVAQSEPAPATSGPDVVHVTIGRVDVRTSVAAPSSAPAARPAQTEKVLSLHDYLRGERAR